MKNLFNKYYYPAMVINKMDTNITIKIAATDLNADVQDSLNEATAEISERMERIQEEFSLTNPTSMINNYRHGENYDLVNSPDFQSIYSKAIFIQSVTKDAYSAFGEKEYNPSDIIVSWAMEDTFNKYLRPLLVNKNIVGISMNAGSDIKFATDPDSEFQWGVQIKGFEDASESVEYNVENLSIATISGEPDLTNYEYDQNTTLEQVTVLDLDAAFAHVWATVGMSLGFEEFLAVIVENKLSGAMIDKDHGLISFNDGVTSLVKQAS
ncbi:MULTISPECIES: hypothetical protein [Lactobacillaceae]|uniref:hypothetical protein n=1 Tax=Lactobacillaceae TaxID=33958 RepID=UPI000C1B7B76|nr:MULTISPECIES: hypothetical protein [Lactobacillaceae]